MSQTADRPIALIGFMGTSKTSSGRLLANALGRPFLDTDVMIQEATGHDIPFIFEHMGEEGFRLLELAAVRNALAQGGCVLALGGGAVLTGAVRALLKAQARTLLLTAAPQEIMQRLQGDTSRPLLAVRDEAAISRMLKDRQPHYAACADGTVDTDGMTPAQICAALLALCAT